MGHPRRRVGRRAGEAPGAAAPIGRGGSSPVAGRGDRQADFFDAPVDFDEEDFDDDFEDSDLDESDFGDEEPPESDFEESDFDDPDSAFSADFREDEGLSVR
jgi:hypothetical protein